MLHSPIHLHYSYSSLSLQDEQPVIDYALQCHVIVAYFILPIQWSGLLPVAIKQAANGNFCVLSLFTLFATADSIETAVLKVVKQGCCICFLCVFDHTLHNNRRDDCLYLIFCLSHPYAVENCSEDDLICIAEVIHKYVFTIKLYTSLIVLQCMQLHSKQRNRGLR